VGWLAWGAIRGRGYSLTYGARDRDRARKSAAIGTKGSSTPAGGEACGCLAAAGVCSAVGRAETGVRPPGLRRVGWGGVERLGMPPGWGHAASGGIASFVPLLPLDLSRPHVPWQFASLVCLDCWVAARIYHMTLGC
jgi:hypothetical protein